MGGVRGGRGNVTKSRTILGVSGRQMIDVEGRGGGAARDRNCIYLRKMGMTVHIVRWKMNSVSMSCLTNNYYYICCRYVIVISSGWVKSYH